MCYICDRCGYQTNNKSHFYRHLIRKTVCIAKSDISIELVREKYGAKPSKYLCPEKTDFKCNICYKYYSTSFNLGKHKQNVHISNSSYRLLYKNIMRNNKKNYETIIVENSKLYTNMMKEVNKINEKPYILLYKNFFIIIYI